MTDEWLASIHEAAGKNSGSYTMDNYLVRSLTEKIYSQRQYIDLVVKAGKIGMEREAKMRKIAADALFQCILDTETEDASDACQDVIATAEAALKKLGFSNTAEGLKDNGSPSFNDAERNTLQSS